MPDNPTPAAKPGSDSDPAEFNFDKPATESPRIKRRSLKAKASGLQPATAPPAAARELEREAPPLSAAPPTRPAVPDPDAKEASKVGTGSVSKSTPVAPPRTTPTVSSTVATSTPTAQKPATATAATPANGTAHHPAATAVASEKPAVAKPATAASQPTAATGQKVNIALTSTQKASATPQPSATSPHGTRPATLYYSSYPKKPTSPSMKPTTTASAAATPTSSSSTTSASTASAARPAGTGAAAPASAARPATTAMAAATTATRPASANIDYRANVERQSREQKSVGSILSYFVYGLIAIFLLGAGLATYGAVIIFGKLHDQSATLADLDAKYALKVGDLDKQLATQQDTLIQAQAQLGRDQDLLSKQEEELNQLRAALTAASSASGEAIKAEIRARTQENAVLRARLRDLEYRTTTTTNQKF